jgi:hypothetical protein
MRVISWNTHKVAAGYQWRVYSFAYGEPTETLKTGTVKTRAIATRLARQWTLRLKRQAVAHLFA